MTPNYLILFSMMYVMAESLEATKNMCKDDMSCFASPKDCELDHCDIAVSFSENDTQIYINDFAYTEYFVIFAEKENVRLDDVVVCFAGANCFLGIEKPNESYTIKNKQTADLTTINEKNGQYRYDFPRVLMETGKEMKYSYRKGFIGEETTNFEIIKLFLMKGSNVESFGEVNANGSDVQDLYRTNAIKRVDSFEERANRFKKSSVHTVTFDDVFRDRMIYDQRDA